MSTSSAPLDDPPAAVTANWGYKVYQGNGSYSGNGDWDVASTADMDRVLDHLESEVARLCPEPSQCDVELYVWVCMLSLEPASSCDLTAMSEAIGWQRVFDRWSEVQLDQIAFLEQRNVNAHWLQSTLSHHRWLQSVLLERAEAAVAAVATERDRVAEDAREKIGALGEQARGEEVVRLANTRWAIRDLEQITQAYQDALDRLRPRYTDVAARFAAYRDGETAVIGALQDLAVRASDASLADIAGLLAELAHHSGVENRTPQQLIMDAQRIRWELTHAQAEYQQGLLHHDALITEKGWPRLDHVTAPREGMTGVADYADDRMRRVNDAIRELLDGIRRREQALILIAADDATRELVGASVAAHTEAAFLDEITARTTELWRNPPTTANLRLPLLAERLRIMEAFLHLESICREGLDTAAWRGPGCLRVAGELTKIRRYLAQTLPFTIRFGVRKLRTTGVVEAELAAIETELAAGRLTAAVHRYDAAVRAAEGT